MDGVYTSATAIRSERRPIENTLYVLAHGGALFEGLGFGVWGMGFEVNGLDDEGGWWKAFPGCPRNKGSAWLRATRFRETRGVQLTDGKCSRIGEPETQDSSVRRRRDFGKRGVFN